MDIGKVECFDVRLKGKDATAYGRMWINNGSVNKMIYKESPIPQGFRKGRVCKSK